MGPPVKRSANVRSASAPSGGVSLASYLLHAPPTASKDAEARTVPSLFSRASTICAVPFMKTLAV